MTASNPTSSETPLIIWAVSDGRAGIEAQVVGLANAVARKRPARIIVKRVGWKSWIGRLPWWLNLAPRSFLTPESDLTPPWPDLWIAAGRATLPLSIRVKGWSKKKTYVVQIQDPRMPTRLFDLVIPPKHDRLSGDNVFPITGSPGRVNAAASSSPRARRKRASCSASTRPAATISSPSTTVPSPATASSPGWRTSA